MSTTLDVVIEGALVSADIRPESGRALPALTGWWTNQEWR